MGALDWAFLGLCMCVALATYVLGVRRGVAMGRRERCGRHSHAEQVAAGRTEPPMHNGPPGRISTADLNRPARLVEGDWPYGAVDGGDPW